MKRKTTGVTHSPEGMQQIFKIGRGATLSITNFSRRRNAVVVVSPLHDSITIRYRKARRRK